MVVQKVLSLRQKTISKLPEVILGKFFAISWTRYFAVRVKKSGPKSRDHPIPSGETEKIMLLYCNLKVYKMKLEINFLLTASTNGELTRLCHKWNVFTFLTQVLVCLIVIGE